MNKPKNLSLVVKMSIIKKISNDRLDRLYDLAELKSRIRVDAEMTDILYYSLSKSLRDVLLFALIEDLK